eukprot:SAG22_NODE_248_length_13909_cov_141.345112_5_plen_150_part_00
MWLQVRRIQAIQNPGLAALYEAQRQMIMRDVGGEDQLNERGGGGDKGSVYHGTDAANVLPICKSGFDDRFWSEGAFGRGAYFAEDPRKPYLFARGGKNSAGEVKMFYVKVIRGQEHELHEDTNWEHHATALCSCFTAYDSYLHSCERGA